MLSQRPSLGRAQSEEGRKVKVGESPLGEEDELGRGSEQSPRASMGVGQAHRRGTESRRDEP